MSMCLLTVDGDGLRCNSFEPSWGIPVSPNWVQISFAALPPNEFTQLRVVFFKRKQCMNRLYLGWYHFVLYITLVLWLHTGEMKGAHP